MVRTEGKLRANWHLQRHGQLGLGPMTTRAILMPAVGDGQGPAELSVGLTLARAPSAHLKAVFIRPDPEEVLEYTGIGATCRDALERQIRQRIDAAGRTEAERHRRRFDTLCRKAGIPKSHRPEAKPAAWRSGGH